jgi:hypothetical protein
MLGKTVLGVVLTGCMVAFGATSMSQGEASLSDADMALAVGSCPNGNGTVTGSYCDQGGILCLTQQIGGNPACCLNSSGRGDCFTEQSPRSNGFSGDWIVFPRDCAGRFREFPCSCNNNNFCVAGAVGPQLVCQPTKTDTKGC